MTNTGTVGYLEEPESTKLAEYELPTPNDGDLLTGSSARTSAARNSPSDAANIPSSGTARSGTRRSAG